MSAQCKSLFHFFKHQIKKKPSSRLTEEDMNSLLAELLKDLDPQLDEDKKD